MALPITPGSGAASVATEQIGNNQYQIIKVVGAETGSTSTLGITPDGSAKVSVIGIPNVFIAGGSIAGTFTTANQSISGTAGASVIGTVPTTQSGTRITSVSGSVNVNGSVAAWLNSTNASVISYVPNSVATVIVGGSIAASFTPPANQSVSGTVQTDVRGSVAVAIISGSIAASFTPPANQSVSGTVQTDVRGSVAVAIIAGSIAATFTPPANQSVSGTVNIGTGGPVSVLGTLSVVGTVPVTQATNPWIITGSVQGTFSAPANQSVSGTAGASVIGWVPIQPSNTSTIAVLQAASIAGTYAEDSAHAQASNGLFVMQVRNDNMSSMTSADGDYSPIAGGPVGETIVANSPITKWVQGTADLRTNSGASVAVIAAQGASVFTYITGVQVANMGSASVLLTLSGATSSIIGYTIAPAGGGSNIVYPNALKTNANGAFTVSISGVASVLVSAQGFTART